MLRPGCLFLACVVYFLRFILAYSGLVSFVDAIYLAGTFGGVIMSVLPVFDAAFGKENR